MNLYITKLNAMGNAMQDMQRMTAEIAHQLGFREMGIYYYNTRGESPEHRNVRLDGIIAGMQAGDIIICQFHTWNGLRFERALVDDMKAYRGRVIIFIHSLEALMIRGSRFMLGETVELYNQAEALIVPSHEMKRFLQNSGIRPDMKFIVQEMWDYTVNINSLDLPGFRKEIHCAGAGDAPYITGWNYDIPLKVYFPTAAKGRNVYRMEASKPDQVLMELSRGGFGLEWYQDEQSYEYMRYGNSYFLSRYLAAGIPVIVPSGISCRKLIEENHLGLAVDSLEEAVKLVEAMGESEYQEYVRHVERFAPGLRNGYYTKKCLIEAVHSLFREDLGKPFIQAEDIYDLGSFAFDGVSLKKSYGGNLALSWNLTGKPDGFLIYDSSGQLIEETENSYQHYFLLKGYTEEENFTVKAYVNTKKGKMVVEESAPVCLSPDSYKKPLVSMVVPAYNAEASISRTVDTILAQSFDGLEIIIVDDGSVDRTSEIIAWYGETYSNIRIIRQENAGLPEARNTGIKHAGGEYIGFVDSDDMIRPDMVKRLYDSAVKNQCDIAVTSVYKIENSGYEPLIGYSISEDTTITIEEFLKQHISCGYALPSVWNKLYRASLVKERLFPKLRFEDEAWTPYVLSYAEKVCYINGYGYEYDRTICPDSLIIKGFSRPKEEMFLDHKNSILFYLEHGNPERRGLLKELAMSELGLFSRTMGYDEYKKLLKQIIEETEISVESN